MTSLWKLVVFILILAAALFASGARFISVLGVVPDLPLLLFTLLFFRTDIGRDLKPATALLLVAVFLALSAVTFRFWFTPALFLGAVILAIYFFGRHITGESFLDLVLAVLLGTAVFYGLEAVFLHRQFQALVALQEFLLTGVLGAVLWFPVGWLNKIWPKQ